ncbi:MAG: prolyl oligopeptidase family serine peptidase [Chloroflexi bacterium]|nr:prolyl oligopeptidase family serine peptidase [Chloroflexota bacterium]
MRGRSILIGATAATAGLLFAGYGVGSVLVYEELTSIGPCPVGWAANSPAAFAILGANGRPLPGHPEFDTEPYWMPAPEDVRIPSRDPGIELSGWYVAAADPAAPTVIVIHGRGACKRDHTALLPAGMLHRNGFAVLLVDLREHGDSTIEDGHFAGGTEEYRDVLGAWDWLRTTKGMAPGRVGLVGISLGAATALIATGLEPRLAAVWADSSYADLPGYIRDELARRGYPTFLDVGAVVAGRILHGDDLAAVSPLESVHRLAGRPIFVTHGEGDEVVKVSDGRDLVAAVEADGGRPGSWFIPGSRHTMAMVEQPAQYEERLVGFFRVALGG